MTAAAFKACYSDFKLVKTRGVIQLVFEVPLHEADMAYQVVGGMPDAAAERWFGIAALKPESEVMPNSAELRQHRNEPASVADTPVRARKSWQDMSLAAQAGIACADPRFWAFLKEQHHAPAFAELPTTDYVRMYCGVVSRADIKPGTEAGRKWNELHNEYRAWLMVPA